MARRNGLVNVSYGHEKRSVSTVELFYEFFAKPIGFYGKTSYNRIIVIERTLQNKRYSSKIEETLCRRKQSLQRNRSQKLH